MTGVGRQRLSELTARYFPFASRRLSMYCRTFSLGRNTPKWPSQSTSASNGPGHLPGFCSRVRASMGVSKVTRVVNNRPSFRRWRLRHGARLVGPGASRPSARGSRFCPRPHARRAANCVADDLANRRGRPVSLRRQKGFPLGAAKFFSRNSCLIISRRFLTEEKGREDPAEGREKEQRLVEARQARGQARGRAFFGRLRSRRREHLLEELDVSAPDWSSRRRR